MNNLWVQTDDATGQHVQAIAGEPGAYRFIDTEVRVSEQDLESPEFIREYLHPYDYTGGIELHQIYGDDALRIAAECVFETNAYSGQILFEGTLVECLRYIDAYVRRITSG